MAESTKKKAKVAAVPDIGEGAAPEERVSAAHGSDGCPVAFCPICTAVGLVQPLSPDVVEHLLNAGREFLLAAKAALDAIASDGSNDDDGSLEKIDIG